MSAAVQYRGWLIDFDPPPIPTRNCDWHFRHEDFDGIEAPDDRYGHAASLDEAKAEIDEREGGPIHPAIDNLRRCQRQLDADGCEVGVSRQALEEALEIVGELLDALRNCRTGWAEGNDIFGPMNAALPVIAKAEGRS